MSSSIITKWTIQCNLTDCIDRNDKFDWFILDFSKAFDCVSHVRLLTKIYNYGIRCKVFDWITHFLSDIIQRTVVNSEYSNWSLVTSDIPQGDVLGPILILIFINDLPLDIESNIKIFADDTKIYNSFNKDTLQEVLIMFHGLLNGYCHIILINVE